MSCKVTSGFTNTCADKLKGSGLGKRFWVGYKSDLDTQISLTQAADISTLDFGPYGVLYPFEGNKFAHDFTWELKVTPGGNISFDQTFNAKLTPGSTAEDLTLQTLLAGDDIFVICEDVNRVFWILGAGNGLVASAGNGGSGGKETGGDTADVISLFSNEITKPLRFSLGAGYDATIAYLNKTT